ncbi:hypothetical protein BGZ83_006171 [Gryganskiella cystojenkinii]|nr:hypothetical protein BGZ83_006171 [Gryganskiella cystojenkinii]
MTSKNDPRAQRYSAQIRASQYDPDFDADYYNYQQQHQRSQRHSISPRASQDLQRPTSSTNRTNSYDHDPISSSSNNSAATTFINLTTQNNNSQGLEETTSLSYDHPSSLVAQKGHRPTTSPSPLSQTTATPGQQLSDSTRPSSPPLPSVSNRFSSFIPSSLRKKTHAKSQSQTSESSDSQGQSFSEQQQHHQQTEQHKPGRTRSPVGTIRGSRSSLQLNLRASQLFHSPPFTSTSASGSNVVGPQSHLSHRSSTSTNKDPTRNSVMNLAQNRQDEARVQLEQERVHVNSHKLTSWTKSKFLLLLANTLLLAYSVGCTMVMVMSWKGVKWTKPYLDSGIMIIANHNLLYLMMVTAPFGIFIALVGYIGIFAQSRKVLTIYAILLWPLFGLITSIGYICYRRLHIQLYQKLKFSWINEYTRDDRLVIQNALSCCGYRSLGDYPSYDLHCFPRAPLPSCENLFLQYQQELLSNTSSAAFILLPVQLLVMVVALLCSNHIDRLYRTAHPITPKLYTQ